jgi:hypothetical protein
LNFDFKIGLNNNQNIELEISKEQEKQYLFKFKFLNNTTEIQQPNLKNLIHNIGNNINNIFKNKT